MQQALDNGRRLLARDPRAAAMQAREILEIAPRTYDALRLYAAAMRGLGRSDDAERFELQAITNFIENPILAQAAAAFGRADLKEVEQLLRPYLQRSHDDPAALTMLGELLNQISVYDEAEAMFRRAIEVVPQFVDARLGLSTVLFRLNRVEESLDELDGLVADEPGNVAAVKAKGFTLSHLGKYDEAIAHYEAFLKRWPNNPDVRINYGHVLKTVGRIDDATSTYRSIADHRPGLGEAWWSLANLKIIKFNDHDIAAMRSGLLDNDARTPENRLQIHFALGKALEDKDLIEQSFEHYAEGNAIRRAMLPHDADMVTDEVRRSRILYTEDFFAERIGQGCPDRDPIFIVGMPRAGSTLIEQILASHSLIEGTSELPYAPALARGLVRDRWRPYPDLLATLAPNEFALLGEDYLARARIHRLTDRPFFIDKMPNNWCELGFIRLMLPNAKIIDARRHPLDCGFSNFKQYFAQGQAFSYDLKDIGFYYRDYVDMMDHIDAALPSRVHRVFHERLIDDPETEIRAIFEYLGLPFEHACLRFHENSRPVRTASSEQVRQPLNRTGVGQWKPFERWIDPLIKALGSTLDDYPC